MGELERGGQWEFSWCRPLYTVSAVGCAGPNWEQFRSAQVPSQLALRSVELGARPNLAGARCSSVVRAFAHGAMGRRIDPSWGGPIELFLVPASAPRLVQQRPWYVLFCLWDGACKIILAANRNE